MLIFYTFENKGSSDVARRLMIFIYGNIEVTEERQQSGRGDITYETEMLTNDVMVWQTVS